VSKTVVMKVCDDATPMRVFIEVDMLKEVHSFRYLGALFGSEAVCGPEIKARLAMASERMGAIERLWGSQTLSNMLKARLIQTLVWPIVTYGSESWTLNLDLTRNIEAFEMQCYRKVLRIPYVDHVTNTEVLGRMGQERMLLKGLNHAS